MGTIVRDAVKRFAPIAEERGVTLSSEIQEHTPAVSADAERLTAEGRFHLCLLNDDELDVRRALRAGGGLEAVAAILLRAVRHKPTGHRLDLGLSTERREMYQLGG